MRRQVRHVGEPIRPFVERLHDDPEVPAVFPQKSVHIGNREREVVEFVALPVSAIASAGRIPVQLKPLRAARRFEDRDCATRFADPHAPRHPHPQDPRVERDGSVEVAHANARVAEAHGHASLRGPPVLP